MASPPGTAKRGELGVDQFLVADQFIALANTKNKKIVATDLHFAMLYAAAQYNAHVGKNVMEVADHDAFIEHMSKHADILREHMADPTV